MRGGAHRRGPPRTCLHQKPAELVDGLVVVGGVRGLVEALAPRLLELVPQRTSGVEEEVVVDVDACDDVFVPTDQVVDAAVDNGLREADADVLLLKLRQEEVVVALAPDAPRVLAAGQVADHLEVVRAVMLVLLRVAEVAEARRDQDEEVAPPFRLGGGWRAEEVGASDILGGAPRPTQDPELDEEARGVVTHSGRERVLDLELPLFVADREAHLFAVLDVLGEPLLLEHEHQVLRVDLVVA